MNIAPQIEEFRRRGFTSAQAETLVLMRAAAVTLFREFPDYFVLFGGANLVLFHHGVRHSADLDLLATTEDRPKTGDIINALEAGLADIAEVLTLNPLSVEVEVADIPELKININGNAGHLFRVDFTRMGGVFSSEIQEEIVEAGATPIQASIQYASKKLMLFHKAEAFLFRRSVKARDAFDILQLQSEGAVLPDHLSNVLADTLSNQEIEAEQIEERIDKVTAVRCKAELEGKIPPGLYESLESSEFSELRSALRRLFARWL